MAKDDYNVIKFKVLVYIYGVLKRRYNFDDDEFNQLLERNNIENGYFLDVIELMLEEGLIKNVSIQRAMGGDGFIMPCLSYIKITYKGINHLEENSLMNKIKEKALSGFNTLLSQIITKVLI